MYLNLTIWKLSLRLTLMLKAHLLFRFISISINDHYLLQFSMCNSKVLIFSFMNKVRWSKWLIKKEE